MNTTAAFNYLATLYERAVGRGLDVTAIRLFLAEQGIRRTPAQVVHDLDDVFAFHGYAASHQPLPTKSLAQSDSEIDSMSSTHVLAYNKAWEANRRAGAV